MRGSRLSGRDTVNAESLGVPARSAVVAGVSERPASGDDSPESLGIAGGGWCLLKNARRQLVPLHEAQMSKPHLVQMRADSCKNNRRV